MSQIIKIATWPASYGINYGADSNNPPAGKSSSMGGSGVDGIEQAIQSAQNYFLFNPATDAIYVNGQVRYAPTVSSLVSKYIPTEKPISIASSELCNPSSPYYVGDAAANAPGGCFTPGYKDGGAIPPTAIKAPDPVPVKEGGKKCPKGSSYDTSKYIGALDPSLCDTGYYATNPGFLSPQRCICNSASKAEQEQAKGDGGAGTDGQGGAGSMGLGDLMKMLPQLLMVMVIVSIIGAFRK